MPEYNFTFDWDRISTLGKVKVLVEQVVGSPSQEAINTAVAEYIEAHPGSLSPLSSAVKSALLQIAEKVAYIDEHGEDYYDALDAALNAKELLSITAVYTQSGTVYDTDSLDSLKADLVVTAYYDDGTSVVISSGYTLSGTLAVGTSTITATYGGKSATFDVVVTDHRQLPTDYTWLYEAEDGVLLRDNSNISFASGGTVIERIENDLLYIATGSSNTGTNLQYKFTDTTTTDAEMSARIQLLATSLMSDGYRRCFSMTLSNGSSGALSDVYFDANNKIVVRSNYGATDESVQYFNTNISADGFHIFTLKLHNGVQSLEIDGQTVYSSNSLSSFYTTMNRFMVQQGGTYSATNKSSVNVDWLAYKEN